MLLDNIETNNIKSIFEIPVFYVLLISLTYHVISCEEKMGGEKVGKCFIKTKIACLASQKVLSQFSRYTSLFSMSTVMNILHNCHILYTDKYIASLPFFRIRAKKAPAG
jgi:hypothetical protein